jgi:uncharacterized membrane protein
VDADGTLKRTGGHSIDLLANAALLSIASATVLLESPAYLRVPFGTLLVLLLPGHALVCALFPSDDGPDGVARAALSVALSLSTVPPVALAIDRSPWRIERTTMTAGLITVTVVALISAVILRHRLPARERYDPQFDQTVLPVPSTWNREQRVVAGLLILAGLLFAVGGYQAAITRLFGEPLTEFALYNADGEARFYPREVTPGQPEVVQLEITNHEQEEVTYRVLVAGDGVMLDQLADVTLTDDETWRSDIRFTVSEVGERQEVRFELYRADQSPDRGPYRTLTLIVDGVPQ